MDIQPSDSDQKISEAGCTPIEDLNNIKDEKYEKLQPEYYENGHKGGKHPAEKKPCVNFDEKIKSETELLGSVTTQNCPGTRTSARVIQKMKQDQTRPTTPPPNEREHKRDDKLVQKTPSQMRTNKPMWTNLERNHFFDALNEFGKDFESIGNYINMKLKRKSTTDYSFKSKEQVRQHYYQTCHKICKYIKFSDEVKKPAQEMYALINYGEMRRKLQFVTDKHFMKLKNLVYQGYISVRCKGKNIRIKTPSCKALRRLNHMDDSLEDIRLPSKIEVIVTPGNMESFGRVQMIAQNPRVRTTVPLHKKLVNFIKTFQYKWRSPEMKLAEEAAKLFPPLPFSEQNAQSSDMQDKQMTCIHQDPEMCFLPKPGVPIHRPLLSITEYLSSVNICLTAYEERMGVKVRGESLNQERHANKRQRTESGSEKRSPDTKKNKHINSALDEKDDACNNTEIVINEEAITCHDIENLHQKSESSGDELSDEINELLSDNDVILREEHVATGACKNDTSNSISSLAINPIQSMPAHHVRVRRATNQKLPARSSHNFKPLISEDVIRRIRKGWTISNALDITIGDLYVALGQDSKLELDYYWTDSSHNAAINAAAALEPELVVGSETTAFLKQKQNGMPYNPNECDDPHLLKSVFTSTVGNKLKHLLLVANLSERIRKRQCSCGHSCERNSTKARLERDLATKSFVSTKKLLPNVVAADSNGCFRQPIAPIRKPVFNMDPVKAALTRQKMSRQVLVQRLLLPGSANHSYDLLDVNNLQTNFSTEQSETTKVFNTVATSQDASTSSTATSQSTSSNSSAETSQSPAPDICNFSTAFEASHQIPANRKPTHEYNVDQESNDETDMQNKDMTTQGSLDDDAFDECSNISIFNATNPMQILRESSSNSRWLEENLNDFSLTSLLGHLDEINANASRDILDPSSNLSVISESSVDYMHKFQEITALMQSQDKD